MPKETKKVPLNELKQLQFDIMFLFRNNQVTDALWKRNAFVTWLRFEKSDIIQIMTKLLNYIEYVKKNYNAVNQK